MDNTSLLKKLKELTSLEQAAKLMDKRYANVDFKNKLASLHLTLGETHTALGNLEEALTSYKEMFRLFEELSAAYPENQYLKNGLSLSYSKLAKTYTALGNLAAALAFFERATKLTGELYVSDLEDVNLLALAAFNSTPSNYPVTVAAGKIVQIPCIGNLERLSRKICDSLGFDDFQQIYERVYDTLVTHTNSKIAMNEKEYNAALADAIKCIIEKREITQRAFAEAYGVSATTISNILAGRRNANFFQLYKAATVLGYEILVETTPGISFTVKNKTCI